MNHPKFILKEDWYLETDILGIKNKTLIFVKGQEFKSNTEGTYEIIYGGWSENTPNIGGRMVLSEESMRTSNNGTDKLFDVIESKEDIEIIIEEIPDDDDILVRSWRIQLDVKTTRKKLKEVEKVINEYVKPILNA